MDMESILYAIGVCGSEVESVRRRVIVVVIVTMAMMMPEKGGYACRSSSVTRSLAC